MWLARPFDDDEPPIFRTSALTGVGMEELEVDMLARVRAAGAVGLVEREPYFLQRWVEDEWGRVGRRFLTEQLGGASAFLAECGGYEAAQSAFTPTLTAHLGS
jgi:hypothetical protein